MLTSQATSLFQGLYPPCFRWIHAPQHCVSQPGRIWWRVLHQWLKGGVAGKELGVCRALLLESSLRWSPDELLPFLLLNCDLLSKRKILHQIVYIFHLLKDLVLQKNPKISLCISLEVELGSCPKVALSFLDCSFLDCIPCFPQLVTVWTCPWGTQEDLGGWSLFPTIRKWGHRKASIPRSLQGSWIVKKQTVSSTPQAPWSSPSIHYKLLLKGNHEPDFLHTTAYFGLTCVLSIKNCLKWILVVQS